MAKVIGLLLVFYFSVVTPVLFATELLPTLTSPCFFRVLMAHLVFVCCAAATICPRPLEVVTWTAPRAAWWPWPLIFWPWKWCGMSAVARTTFMPILVFLRLFAVELWANASDWWRDVVTLTFDLWPWCLTCDVTALVGACRSSYFIAVPSLKFVRLPFGRYGVFSVSALIGLVTLTFRPLNGVTGHQYHGLSSCQFSACYALPFSTDTRIAISA